MNMSFKFKFKKLIIHIIKTYRVYRANPSKIVKNFKKNSKEKLLDGSARQNIKY